MALCKRCNAVLVAGDVVTTAGMQFLWFMIRPAGESWDAVCLRGKDGWVGTVALKTDDLRHVWCYEGGSR